MLFFNYGIRSVSMDDLARAVGVSKKKLYEHYADKNNLVEKLVQDLITSHASLCRSNKLAAKDAIDEVLRQSVQPFRTWTALKAGFYYELEKYFPRAWQLLNDHKAAMVRPDVVRNLKRGQKEGLYQQDLDTSFIADLRLQQLTTALQPDDWFSKKLQGDILVRQLTVFYLNAITTEKGRKLLHQYTSTTNEKAS